MNAGTNAIVEIISRMTEDVELSSVLSYYVPFTGYTKFFSVYHSSLLISS